jgi:hypothetical protein
MAVEAAKPICSDWFGLAAFRVYDQRLTSAGELPEVARIACADC